MVNFLQLPGYQVSNPVDFSPISNALDSNRQLALANQKNALAQRQLGLAERADMRASESHGVQMQSARTQQELQQARMAAGRVQGIMQLPAEQRAAAWAAARKMPGFSDLPADFDNFEFAAPQILNKAREYMSEKDQAQLGLIRAQTAKAQREAAVGPERYGKDIKIFQGPDGKIYGVQAGASGELKYHDLNAPGGSGGGSVPPGAAAPSAAAPRPSGQPGQPLTPYAPRKVIGDRVFNPGTGGFEGSARDAVAGGEQAKAEGDELGKLRSSLTKQRLKMRLFDDKSTRAISTIDKAIAIIGDNTAGYGALLKGLPAAQARQLEGYLNTIKANVTFEELQAMREASPTGGALGQVSNFENELLSSVRAAIDQLQKGENLRENLMVIRDSMEKIKRIKADAFAEDEARAYGEAPITGIRQSQGAPPAGAIQLLRSNPAPEVIQMFEQKYGPGSARQFLGGQ